VIEYNKIVNNSRYIKLNLQYFASNEGGEKTEEPTGKKREDARKEGQVAKSVEVTTAFLFLGMFFSLKSISKYMYNGMLSVMNYSISLFPMINDGIFEVDFINKLVPYIFGKIMIIVAPLFLVAMVVGVISNLIQVGCIVIYNLIKKEINSIQLLLDMGVLQAIVYIGNLIIEIGLAVGMYFLFLALADFMYQKFDLKKNLKMTKQEVKEEYKNSEGNPEIKGKIKQRMREASMRRMMADIPKADVIITNPTHFAVAIQYDKEKALAPIVIAKGADFLAQRIKEVARENNVEIIENKYLARTLYATVDIGREIPEELYQAVAEVLAFVYNIKNK
jgi:flagellar biosynthetic protein FlhB